MSGVEAFKSRFSPGQAVVVLRDISNDGSYQAFGKGELLAGEGDRGKILGVGFQEGRSRVVYLVGLRSDSRVIGCFEEDLLPIQEKGRSLRSGGAEAGRKKTLEGVRNGRDL